MRLDSDSIHSGRNADNQGNGQPYPPGSTSGPQNLRDDRFVRCARCGFICHLDRDKRSPEGSREGWGITYATNDTAYNDANVSYNDMLVVYNDTNLNDMDPIVVAGCPQCGTLLYDK